jgi:uncharacterized membrane protein YebE (DUF533 family)
MEAPMFDAKSLIEMMMRGASSAPQQPQGGGGGLGGLGDLLGKLGGAGGGGQQAPQGGGGGLGDILGRMGGAMGSGGASQGGQASGGGHEQGAQGGGGAGLGDLLRQIQGGGGGAQGHPGAPGAAPSGGGGIMDILGSVLGQATSGVREGAQRVDDMTGASRRMQDMSGMSPDQALGKLREMVANNPALAGLGAAGVGAAVLGTKTGRAIAGRAAKIGGMAMIGGLAYKALQNWQSGKPLISGKSEVAAAPQGTGFEEQAVSNDAALLYVRGMIAAAAADGRIDAGEQQKILGNLQQMGLNSQAEQFLAEELNNPASVDDLIGGVTTEQEAVQLFTACRLAIDIDTNEEQQFLMQLAQGLNLDAKLVGHIDAAARNAH